MLNTILVLWLISAIFILLARNVFRTIICFSMFSLVSALAFLFLGAPDVAMAEAAVGGFVMIFFVVCFEKYYDFGYEPAEKRRFGEMVRKCIVPFLFVVFLFGLFVAFIPQEVGSGYLRELYITNFIADVGGLNPVTAIYLGYRVYDTLFEALILLVAVLAIIHVSWYTEEEVKDGPKSKIERYPVAIYPIRMAAPIILIFGIYLTLNGALSPGGGFQGGVIVACFFVGRYMIYDIYDMPVKKMATGKKLIFLLIILAAVLMVFLGLGIHIPLVYRPQVNFIYLSVMNILIGAKVALGFIALFYRYVAIDRR